MRTSHDGLIMIRPVSNFRLHFLVSLKDCAFTKIKKTCNNTCKTPRLHLHSESHSRKILSAGKLSQILRPRKFYRPKRIQKQGLLRLFCLKHIFCSTSQMSKCFAFDFVCTSYYNSIITIYCGHHYYFSNISELIAKD